MKGSIFTNLTKRSFLLFLIGVPYIISAQHSELTSIHHCEVPIGKNERLLLTKTRGLFIYDLALTAKTISLNIINIDTALHENWRGQLNLELEANASLVAQIQREEGIYLLFRMSQLSKFNLVFIDLANKGYKIYDLENFILTNQSTFHVTSSVALIGGYYNNIPVILSFNLKTQEQKTLSGGFKANEKLMQIRIYQDDTFDVLTKTGKTYSKSQTISVKCYNEEGKFIKNHILQSESPQSLNYNNSIKTNDTLQIITGLFGKPGAKYANGIFTSVLDKSGLTYPTSYFGFKEMKSFSGYLNLKQKPRDSFNLNIKFYTHGLMFSGNEYFIIGEAEYPKYASADYNYLGKKLSNADRNRSRFMVVICFDLFGNILWDTNIICPPTPYLGLSVQKKQVALLYSMQGVIRSILINNVEVREGPTLQFSKSQGGGGSRQLNNVSHWYDNFFITYRRVNTLTSDNSVVSALSINKIRLKIN